MMVCRWKEGVLFEHLWREGFRFLAWHTHYHWDIAEEYTELVQDIFQIKIRAPSTDFQNVRPSPAPPDSARQLRAASRCARWPRCSRRAGRWWTALLSWYLWKHCFSCLTLYKVYSIRQQSRSNYSDAVTRTFSSWWHTSCVYKQRTTDKLEVQKEKNKWIPKWNKIINKMNIAPMFNHSS